jgi:hypothetical protein
MPTPVPITPQPTPQSTTTPTNTTKPQHAGSSSGTMVDDAVVAIGWSVGVIVLLILCLVILVFVIRRRRSTRLKPFTFEEDGNAIEMKTKVQVLFVLFFIFKINACFFLLSSFLLGLNLLDLIPSWRTL